MAAYFRNVTLLSSSFLKSLPAKSKCNQFYILRKHFHIFNRVPIGNKQCLLSHTSNQTWFALSVARHASSQSTTLPPGYIPDIPSPHVPSIPELPELNALGEPTLNSVGLGSFTPSGLIQQLLEWIHVTLDVPWWCAIFAVAMLSRLLIFPVVIKQRKNLILFKNHMPTIHRLQERLKDAQVRGDQMDAAIASTDLASFMKKNNVPVVKALFLSPMVQVPVMLSVFYGLRQMTVVPVETFKEGGFGWITDLTVMDPYYVLPFVTSVTILLIVEMGADSASTAEMQHTMKWFMRTVPLVILAVTYSFPSALTFYWTANNIFSLAQGQILKMPSVKRYLNFPEEIKHPKNAVPKKKFLEGFQEAIDNSKLQSQSRNRRMVEEAEFKKAGIGPIPKTYRYDPTKKRNQSAL